jgi:hypothetical protein
MNIIFNSKDIIINISQFLRFNEICELKEVNRNYNTWFNTYSNAYSSKLSIMIHDLPPYTYIKTLLKNIKIYWMYKYSDWLSDTNITNLVISNNIIQFRNLPKTLTHLNITTNIATKHDMYSFREMTNLQSLSLDETFLTTGAIEQLPTNLTRLSLFSTGIHGEQLNNYKSETLTELDISACDIITESFFSSIATNIPNLKILHCSHFPSIVRKIRNLSKTITFLNLTNCNLDAMESFQFLANHPIKTLILRNNENYFINTEINPLPKTLTYLDLSGTNIGNDDLKLIDSCPNLIKLDLSETLISDAGISNLPNHIMSLDISKCPYVMGLCKYPLQLMNLDLSRCQSLISNFVMTLPGTIAKLTIIGIRYVSHENMMSYLPNDIAYINVEECGFFDTHLDTLRKHFTKAIIVS